MVPDITGDMIFYAVLGIVAVVAFSLHPVAGVIIAIGGVAVYKRPDFISRWVNRITTTTKIFYLIVILLGAFVLMSYAGIVGVVMGAIILLLILIGTADEIGWI